MGRLKNKSCCTTRFFGILYKVVQGLKIQEEPREAMKWKS